MKRVLPAILILLGACTWSNSLYQARRLSSAAAQAEREERNFDAGSLWGQVAVKADTAYARNPDGRAGAEALWLRGRALARLGDCPGALPVLERALVAVIEADWSDDLRVELARCRTLGGDPQGALELLEPIVAAGEGRAQEEARRLAGRALVNAGRWDEALAMLAEEESVAGRWERAIALAELGRTADALETLEPRITMADSSADWDRLVRITARRDPAMVDTLLARLGAMRNASDTARARWLLGAAEAALASDPATGTRRLEALVAMPASPAVSQGRILLIDRRVAAVRDSGTLAATIEGLGGLVGRDATATYTAERFARWGRGVLREVAALSADTTEGDKALFFQATIARDTLHAPALASWLLLQIEQRWPESPYVPKAMLARIPLVPDSAAAIRTRLAAHQDSPYLAFLSGREGERFAALEDALGFYIDSRFAELMAGGGQEVN